MKKQRITKLKPLEEVKLTPFNQHVIVEKLQSKVQEATEKINDLITKTNKLEKALLKKDEEK